MIVSCICAPGHHTAKHEESARDNHVLGCKFVQYSPTLKFVSLTDSATPPHFKYVAGNLLLMACFGDTNVSQGSVATYARCGGIFDNHLTANYQGNSQ